MTDIYKLDAQGRIVTAQSTPSLNLTTATINSEILLANTTLGSSGSFDVDLSLLTDGLTCEHLRIVCLLRGSISSLLDAVYLFFNNDTTVTNYYSQRLNATAGSPFASFDNIPSVGFCIGNTGEINNFTPISIFIPDYRNTSKEKISQIGFSQYESTTNARAGVLAHQWQNTTSISRIQIRTDNNPTDLFVSGSEIWVYGEKSLSVVTNVTIS